MDIANYIQNLYLKRILPIRFMSYSAVSVIIKINSLTLHIKEKLMILNLQKMKGKRSKRFTRFSTTTASFRYSL